MYCAMSLFSHYQRAIFSIVFAFVKFRINDGVAQNPRYNFKIDKKSIDNIDGTGNTTTMQTYLYLKYIYMSI
jgi:hypothetical protein